MQSVVQRNTPEHTLQVVGYRSVVYGVVHPCQILSMPHITLSKQWDSISIDASSSFDHCATTEVHGLSSFFQKPA